MIPPHVSVIIPTIGRSSLRLAVESVLKQTSCIPEAIVVLDKPSQIESVNQLLYGLNVRLFTTDSLGASAARNLGVLQANGDYIGFLDDDDVLLPNKCALQLNAIRHSRDPRNTFAVAPSEFISSTGQVRQKNPRIFRPDVESFSSYLLSRKTLRFGSVLFNTPSILGPASLIKSMTWDSRLKKHQDWDYLIRLMSTPNVAWVPITEPMIRVFQGSDGSISRQQSWVHGADFLEKHSAEVSGAARTDFVLLHILIHAIRGRSRSGIKASIKFLDGSLPHPAAFARFFLGLVLRK